MNSPWSHAHCYVVGCGVDCHAMNFQPFGVFVQALRNTSLKAPFQTPELRQVPRGASDVPAPSWFRRG